MQFYVNHRRAFDLMWILVLYKFLHHHYHELVNFRKQNRYSRTGVQYTQCHCAPHQHLAM